MRKRRFGFSSHLFTTEERIYFKSMKLATIEKQGLDKVIEIYKNNIDTASQIISYCKRNKIYFYRLGTLFPFNTHKILNSFDYFSYFEDDLYELGQLIKFSKIRICIHSSPYCILSSVKDDIFKKAVMELEHHAKLMNVLELSPENRIVVHVGGIEGGKEIAKQRFISNFNKLKEDVRNRLVLENDDKMFSFKDVQDINCQTGVPIVLDIFHHKCYNPENIDEIEALDKSCQTWKKEETPEIHFSSQDPEKAKGSHSAILNVNQLLTFLSKSDHLPFDIMLETSGTNIEVEKILQELPL